MHPRIQQRRTDLAVERFGAMKLELLGQIAAIEAFVAALSDDEPGFDCAQVVGALATARSTLA